MHYLRALTLVSAGFGLASASALHASLLERGATIPATMRLTDTIASIDLDEYERSVTVGANSLEKRLNIDICTATSARAGVCVAAGALGVSVANFVSTTAIAIASLLKTNSNNNDCSVHDGTIDGVTYKVYATGSHCDTTAQFNTISGAVTKYIHAQRDSICGVHCLKLSHSGTWIGYVTIAPAGENLNPFYCGASNSFGKCLSGGSNDNN